ncbi:MAG: hypothetical protein JSR89_02760 [Proteobacteria bacterium]|nr:hypothetical protein [Pseudomonadota bacterium]
MSRNSLGPVGLDKLEAALDAYGADRTRWPAPLRLALSGLIAGNSKAQRMLRDAEAFDRLLDQAPQYDQSRLDGLSQRILATAERQPRVMTNRSRITRESAGRPAAWSWQRRHQGFAATALAASLVLGVFAGQLNVLNSSADVLLGGNANASSTRIAQSDDADVLLDEDLL